MAYKPKRVFIALSGGVDSAASAAMLLEKGYECTGVYMLTHDQGIAGQADAEKVAEKLGIALCVLDLREDFRTILDYFCRQYRTGRTPNPCVVCNRTIKFGKLFEFAKSKGADFFATGHYARVLKTAGQYGLYQAVHSSKDQSYALAMVKPDVLGSVLFVMGDYSKDKARRITAELGLEKKEESQEICFIPDNNYVGALERMCPELVRKGYIVDIDGNVIGEHNGVHKFTIGQRRGLRVAMGRPYYVVAIDAESNTVTLGPREQLLRSKLTATDVNWLVDEPTEAFRAAVKIRYNSPAVPARVKPGGSRVEIEFDKPLYAITPGQLAVFYIEDEIGMKVAGGGWIQRAFD